MANEPLAELILHGHEERNLEYKRSTPWEGAEFREKLCRSIMGMANLRDGGAIVIGVSEEADGSFTPRGMTADHTRNYDHDALAPFVSNFAAPFVEFDVRRTRLSIDHEEREFIVIQVREFTEVPIVCRQSGSHYLSEGALYTRKRRVHETAAVASEAEMREIVDLAVDKQLRRFRTRAEEAGFELTDPGRDRHRFEAELGDL